MTSVPRFDIWRQRTALTDLAEDGAGFLREPEGLAFIEQMYMFLAPNLVGVARKKFGYALDRDEGVNLIIEQLLASRRLDDKGAVRKAAAAENPWAYLRGCAMDWMRQQWGVRGASLEAVGDMAVSSFEDVAHENPHTPIHDVVRLTFSVVSEVIPAVHHDAVFELLTWAAVNPPQRLSYETDDRVAAHRHCPSLTIDQVIAVMKIARGSRQNTAATSLMGQFLLNRDFRVSDSGTHARALMHFKNAFRAGEGGSKMLIDWTSR